MCEVTGTRRHCDDRGRAGFMWRISRNHLELLEVGMLFLQSLWDQYGPTDSFPSIFCSLASWGNTFRFFILGNKKYTVCTVTPVSSFVDYYMMSFSPWHMLYTTFPQRSKWLRIWMLEEEKCISNWIDTYICI